MKPCVRVSPIDTIQQDLGVKVEKHLRVTRKKFRSCSARGRPGARESTLWPREFSVSTRTAYNFMCNKRLNRYLQSDKVKRRTHIAPSMLSSSSAGRTIQHRTPLHSHLPVLMVELMTTITLVRVRKTKAFGLH